MKNKTVSAVNRFLKSSFLSILLVSAVCVIFFTSCKNQNRSLRYAKEFFKSYKIPEKIYQEEWGMVEYKLFNPRLEQWGKQNKTDNESIYRVTYRRWCKGKDESGMIKKLRLIIFVDVKIIDEVNLEIANQGIQNVFPLKFGRQLSSWIGYIIFGLIYLAYYTGFSARTTGGLLILQLIWGGWVGYISYLCFMSGWGVVLGLLINGTLINLFRMASRRNTYAY